YNVKVVVETNHGCLDSTTSIAVVNPKPSIQSVLTPAACEGNATSFSQTSVVSAVNGASIAQFDWDFGDGTLAQGSSTSHLYAVPGSYSGNLIVTTNHGCADTMSWQTDVNPKPVISSIQTAPVCEGEQVLLAQT